MSERATYWQGLVAAWERSGLSQAEFCRRRGIKAVTFAWWKRRLNGTTDRAGQHRPRGSTAGDPGAPATFVEVGLPSRLFAGGVTAAPSSAAPATDYEIVLPGGALIRLPRNFDPDQVRQLLRAVVSSC
jgi:hypothetical protein